MVNRVWCGHRVKAQRAQKRAIDDMKSFKNFGHIGKDKQNKIADKQWLRKQKKGIKSEKHCK